MPKNDFRSVAISAAQLAGKELLARYYKYNRSDAKFKSAHEIVTKADVAAESIIIKKIKASFPDHKILSEEAGNIAGASEYLWIIDPLDGTHNFSMRNPLWAVSIALVRGGEIILGVVFAPVLNEIFLAQYGQGSWVNGKRMKVSEYRGERVINTFCTGSKNPDIKKALKYFIKQKANKLDCRQLGSASIEMAYVACGRVESFITPGVNSWDVSAGALLVSEAGGKVTDFKNKKWTIKSRDIAASNGKVHGEILKVINGK
jgi:myo-inositol-1(or 4)-monophosphatase